jgi:hypothetical protein
MQEMEHLSSLLNEMLFLGLFLLIMSMINLVIGEFNSGYWLLGYFVGKGLFEKI